MRFSKPWARKLIFISLVSSLLIAFQNCGNIDFNYTITHPEIPSEQLGNPIDQDTSYVEKNSFHPEEGLATPNFQWEPVRGTIRYYIHAHQYIKNDHYFIRSFVSPKEAGCEDEIKPCSYSPRYNENLDRSHPWNQVMTFIVGKPAYFSIYPYGSKSKKWSSKSKFNVVDGQLVKIENKWGVKSYATKTNEGFTITEGDVVLISTDNNTKSNTKNFSEKNYKPGVVDLERLWKNAEIPYIISDGFDQSYKDRILHAIKKWNQSTVVQMVPREADDYYVLFTPSDGCSSPIGSYESTGNEKQNIYLAPPHPSGIHDGCSVGNIMHEIGHTAGVGHEQNRFDSDQFIKINYDNIEPGKEHNFSTNVFWDPKMTNYGPYDYKSIMHYGGYTFSKNGKPTIEVINWAGSPPPELGQRDRLTTADRFAIRQMYERNTPKILGYQIFFDENESSIPDSNDIRMISIARDDRNRYQIYLDFYDEGAIETLANRSLYLYIDTTSSRYLIDIDDQKYQIKRETSPGHFTELIYTGGTVQLERQIGLLFSRNFFDKKSFKYWAYWMASKDRIPNSGTDLVFSYKFYPDVFKGLNIKKFLEIKNNYDTDPYKWNLKAQGIIDKNFYISTFEFLGDQDINPNKYFLKLHFKENITKETLDKFGIFISIFKDGEKLDQMFYKPTSTTFLLGGWSPHRQLVQTGDKEAVLQVSFEQFHGFGSGSGWEFEIFTGANQVIPTEGSSPIPPRIPINF